MDASFATLAFSAGMAALVGAMWVGGVNEKFKDLFRRVGELEKQRRENRP